MIVSQMSKQEQSTQLSAQLLLCPITDFAAETESRRDFAEGYLLDKAMMIRDLEHYLPASMDARDPCISPLRASDFSGLPPAYIHTAEFDPVRDEGRACRRVGACRCESELYMPPRNDASFLWNG